MNIRCTFHIFMYGYVTLHVISLKERGGLILTLFDYCSFFDVSIFSGSNSSHNSSLSCWRK